jgi:hypothetical protein
MNALPIILFAALIASPIPGCRQKENQPHRFADVDGGPPPDRKECEAQTLECFDKCYNRQASVTCIGCCRDQDALCRMQQKYSFAYCETSQ